MKWFSNWLATPGNSVPRMGTPEQARKRTAVFSGKRLHCTTFAVRTGLSVPTVPSVGA